MRRFHGFTTGEETDNTGPSYNSSNKSEQPRQRYENQKKEQIQQAMADLNTNLSKFPAGLNASMEELNKSMSELENSLMGQFINRRATAQSNLRTSKRKSANRKGTSGDNKWKAFVKVFVMIITMALILLMFFGLVVVCS